MATYYRNANVIYTDDKKTIFSTDTSINAAKRSSRKLQKAGDTVIVIRRKGGRK